MPMGVRSAVMASLASGAFPFRVKKKGPVGRMEFLGHVLRWGMVHGMTHRRVVRVNVEELVGQWVEAVVGMCLAHDKDTYDAHDARADALLGPLLTAPVKQVREFYAKLLDRMRADQRVPMLVWMGFEAWGEVLVKDAPDEGVKKLKHRLAQDIADLVELDVREQIPKAIARALRWRDPETLREVKETLQAGAKPKLVGRESCLYLEVTPRKRGQKKVSVML
jgi:hypothetical protein